MIQLNLHRLFSVYVHAAFYMSKELFFFPVGNDRARDGVED